MRRLLFLILLFAMLPAHACRWDRDTLAEEAKGKLDTVKAITGWFDRYPPRYYEMRLERVTKELAARPEALDLYDDAGVACDHLGRYDEALVWMAKKKAVLDALPDGGPAEDRYRYLSNTGTFHLIRWILKPEAERAADLGDLRASETFIAQAIELNPDAHFGREKFQLMLIRWLLSTPPDDDWNDANFLGLEGRLWSRPSRGSAEPDFTLEEARQGLNGLIQIGAAWQSIDTFRTLQVCLHLEQSATLAHLAYLRQEELAAAGAVSFHLSPRIRETMKPHGESGSFYGAEKIGRFYREARAAADARHAAWTAYQEERFAQGIHPDTHPDFWKDWREPAFPKLPGLTFWQFSERHPALTLGTVLAILIGAFIVIIWMGKRLHRRARQRQPFPA